MEASLFARAARTVEACTTATLTLATQAPHHERIDRQRTRMVEQLVELLIVLLGRARESRADRQVTSLVLHPPGTLELDDRDLALREFGRVRIERGRIGSHAAHRCRAAPPVTSTPDDSCCSTGPDGATRRPGYRAPAMSAADHAPTRPFLIGVAGGTCSGKTTVSERLAELAGEAHLALIKLDSYYVSRDDQAIEERALANYDHPDAFDWQLLNDHIAALANGATVPVPIYDYTQHTRSGEVRMVPPARIVVVEGILVLYEPQLRDRFDLKVYVDTDADLRLIRRLQRDVVERGRTPESIVSQYLATVRPSHEQFIEPSKRHADVIFPQGGMNEPALEVLLARVRELVRMH